MLPASLTRPHARQVYAGGTAGGEAPVPGGGVVGYLYLEEEGLAGHLCLEEEEEEEEEGGVPLPGGGGGGGASAGGGPGLAGGNAPDSSSGLRP